jgi:hypothetical protein
MNYGGYGLLSKGLRGWYWYELGLGIIVVRGDNGDKI